MCFPFCAHCRASCCHNFLFSRALFSSPNAYRPTSRSGHCIVFPLSTLWPKYIKITARTADEVVFYIKQHSSLSSAGYIYIYRTQKALQEMSFDNIFGCGCLLFLLLPIIFHASEKSKKNNLKALKSKKAWNESPSTSLISYAAALHWAFSVANIFFASSASL
jgi:hypothetical protein